jgi:hypothetical protein
MVPASVKWKVPFMTSGTDRVSHVPILFTVTSAPASDLERESREATRACLDMHHIVSTRMERRELGL